MDINVSQLGGVLVLWLAFSAVVTAATWTVAKTRVDAPGTVTACNLFLSFFPPFNLLVLTLLSAMNRKGPP